MRPTSVRTIAKVLNILVLIAFAGSLVILYLIPTAVFVSGGCGLLEGICSYLSGLLHPGEDDIVIAAVAGSALIWLTGWFEFDAYSLVLTLFLLFSGVCIAGILWQGRRVLKAILRGEPFSTENAVSLRRAAVCAFLISAAALIRVVFGLFYTRSLLSLTTYNALFDPIFAMAGLLCLIMSALFRQAAELKAENDLII